MKQSNTECVAAKEVLEKRQLCLHHKMKYFLHVVTDSGYVACKVVPVFKGSVTELKRANRVIVAVSASQIIIGQCRLTSIGGKKKVKLS